MNDAAPAHRPKDPHDFYFSGATPFFVSRYDPRLSYALYVPFQDGRSAAGRPLVVVQHGTGRTAETYRNAMATFAEQHGCVVLTPLFPAGVSGPDDLHGFKFLRAGDLRYDLALLDIVAEVHERFGVDADRFYLHGFSGGGQFTHRFLYFHPERLAGVSVGAPGRVTLLDPDRQWWLGLRDAEREVGAAPKLDQLARVPVQLVVGDQDVETWEIDNPGHANWMAGQEEAGSTRVERLRTLGRTYAEHGIDVRLDIVPGVAHHGPSVLEKVKEFFADLLTRHAEACR